MSKYGELSKLKKMEWTINEGHEKRLRIPRINITRDFLRYHEDKRGGERDYRDLLVDTLAFIWEIPGYDNYDETLHAIVDKWLDSKDLDILEDLEKLALKVETNKQSSTKATEQ